MDALTSAIFPFSAGNTVFGQILSKITKLLVSAETWYLVWLEINGGIHFFLFPTEIPPFGQIES